MRLVRDWSFYQPGQPVWVFKECDQDSSFQNEITRKVSQFPGMSWTHFQSLTDNQYQNIIAMQTEEICPRNNYCLTINFKLQLFKEEFLGKSEIATLLSQIDVSKFSAIELIFMENEQINDLNLEKIQLALESAAANYLGTKKLIIHSHKGNYLSPKSFYVLAQPFKRLEEIELFIASKVDNSTGSWIKCFGDIIGTHKFSRISVTCDSAFSIGLSKEQLQISLDKAQQFSVDDLQAFTRIMVFQAFQKFKLCIGSHNNVSNLLADISQAIKAKEVGLRDFRLQIGNSCQMKRESLGQLLETVITKSRDFAVLKLKFGQQIEVDTFLFPLIFRALQNGLEVLHLQVDNQTYIFKTDPNTLSSLFEHRLRKLTLKLGLINDFSESGMLILRQLLHTSCLKKASLSLKSLNQVPTYRYMLLNVIAHLSKHQSLVQLKFLSQYEQQTGLECEAALGLSNLIHRNPQLKRLQIDLGKNVERDNFTNFFSNTMQCKSLLKIDLTFPFGQNLSALADMVFKFHELTSLQVFKLQLKGSNNISYQGIKKLLFSVLSSPSLICFNFINHLQLKPFEKRQMQIPYGIVQGSQVDTETFENTKLLAELINRSKSRHIFNFQFIGNSTSFDKGGVFYQYNFQQLYLKSILTLELAQCFQNIKAPTQTLTIDCTDYQIIDTIWKAELIEWILIWLNKQQEVSISLPGLIIKGNVDQQNLTVEVLNEEVFQILKNQNKQTWRSFKFENNKLEQLEVLQFLRQSLQNQLDQKQLTEFDYSINPIEVSFSDQTMKILQINLNEQEGLFLFFEILEQLSKFNVLQFKTFLSVQPLQIEWSVFFSKFLGFGTLKDLQIIFKPLNLLEASTKNYCTYQLGLFNVMVKLPYLTSVKINDEGLFGQYFLMNSQGQLQNLRNWIQQQQNMQDPNNNLAANNNNQGMQNEEEDDDEQDAPQQPVNQLELAERIQQATQRYREMKENIELSKELVKQQREILLAKHRFLFLHQVIEKMFKGKFNSRLNDILSMFF